MARTQRNAAPETVTIASHRSAGQTTPTDTHPARCGRGRGGYARPRPAVPRRRGQAARHACGGLAWRLSSR